MALIYSQTKSGSHPPVEKSTCIGLVVQKTSTLRNEERDKLVLVADSRYWTFTNVKRKMTEYFDPGNSLIYEQLLPLG